jgi:hypothetical protein
VPADPDGLKRRESALSIARRLGHDIPSEAEQRANIDAAVGTGARLDDLARSESTATLGVPLVPVEPNPCEACPHSYVGAEACKTCTGPESQQQGEP